MIQIMVYWDIIGVEVLFFDFKVKIGLFIPDRR